MKTQYRLLQWYPTLPKSWKLFKDDVIVTKRGDVYMGDMTSIPSYEVENNPDYWELVEHDIFEILSFYRDDKVYKVVSDGNLIWDIPEYEDVDKNPGSVNVSNATEKGYLVRSIKRLSDGEILSVDDKTDEGVIIRIDTNGTIYTNNGGICGSQTSCFENIKVISDPIFTTEDGVGIYEGDEYWFVVPDQWTHEMGVASSGSGRIKELIYFSEEEQAKNYISNHKPIYSESQVRHALNKGLLRSGKLHRRKFWRTLKDIEDNESDNNV